MKIKELSIDRYGAWSNLQLGEFEDGLTVVYGMNGSATTTLVQFVQAMLFGVPQFQERPAPAQISAWGGSLTVEIPRGRWTLRRRGDGTRSGRLSLRGDDGAAIDRDVLSEMLAGVAESVFRLIFSASFRDPPATESLVQAAAMNGLALMEPCVDWRDRGKPEPLDFLGEIERLKERRRATETELVEMERQRLKWRRRREEEERRVANDIDGCQAELLRLRGELQMLDDEIAPREHRSMQPAGDGVSNDLAPRGASLQRRLRAVRGQLARWRKVQHDVLRRRARLRREMLSWTGDANGSPAAFWSGAQNHIDQIEQRLEKLHEEVRTLAGSVATESGNGSDASLRCSPLVESIRDEVYGLCRGLNRHYLEQRRETITEELRQLRSCYAMVAWRLQRLGIRRQRIEQEVQAENAVLAPIRRRRQETAEQLRQCESRLSKLHAEMRGLESVSSAEEDSRWETRRRKLDAIQADLDRRIDRLKSLAADPRSQPEPAPLRTQASIIDEASENLRRLTDGQFVRIHASKHESTLGIEDAEGELLPIDGPCRSWSDYRKPREDAAPLSRSVRDRVHLALCLAIVEAYARQGVRLPMILDDAFINLDAAQSQRLGEILREFAARGRQILVFTSREHVARMFRRMDVSVLELPPEAGLPEPGVIRRESEPVRVRAGAAVLESLAPAGTRRAEVVQTSPFPSAASDLRADANHGRSYLRRSDAIEYAPELDSAAARELSSQGIASIGDFLALSPPAAEQRLSRLNVPMETIRRWQAVARLMCDTPNLRAYDARILAASGITSADELERLAPEELLERVAQCLETETGRTLFRQGEDEELARLASWIGSGRTTQTLRETQKRNGFKQSA